MQTEDKQVENKQKTLRKVHQKGFSLISAKIHVSESEIAMQYPDYVSDWIETKPFKFQEILWDFGLDSTQEYILQEVTSHRNRLGEQVTCGRYYGNERLDDDWIKSGYASQSAKDKALNNKLLDESYRARYETEDTQDYLERRDMYDKSNKD
jgi:hypothetical protein